MKNIWKFLLIALLAFAMIGCPATKEEDDDDNGSGSSQQGGTTPTTVSTTTTTTVASTGDYVFYADLSIDEIATAWGGGPDKPSFAILLMPSTLLEGLANGDITDPQGIPSGTTAFQIKVDNNASFAILDKAGATGVYDGGSMDYYSGMAAEFDGNGRVKVYVDLDNVLPNQLKCLGEDYPNGEQYYKDAATKPTFDKTTLVAASIALCPSTLENGDENPNITGSFWNADLIKMVKAEKINGASAFPSHIDFPELEKPKTLADINYIVGTINGWNEKGTESNLSDGVYTYDNTTDAAVTVEFKYIVAGNGWDFQAGPEAGIDGAELDTNITLKKSSNAPTIKFSAEAGKSYTITYVYDDGEAYCTIHEVE